MKSVLITGGTGFFGQAFVSYVLEKIPTCHRICIFSRDEYKQHIMRTKFANDERLRFFIGDVRDQERLRRAMQDVEVVVHAAALKRLEVGEYNPGELVRTNVMGSMNVISAATDAGVKRAVLLSTDKACEPANAYGASKLMAEKLFLAANNTRGTDGPWFAVCRYGNVAGSTGSVIPIWIEKLEKQIPLLVTNIHATRFWMTKQQAVELVLKAISNVVRDKMLFIPELPAYELGHLFKAITGRFATMCDVGECNVVGLGPGEKMHESMIPGKTSEHARRMSIDELREALKHV